SLVVLELRLDPPHHRVGLDHHVERSVALDEADRGRQTEPRSVPILLLHVVRSDTERDGSALLREAIAELLVEELRVADCLFLLAEAEAEQRGVGKRLVRVLTLRILAGVALVPARSFVVDSDRLVVTADLVDGLLRERALVEAVLRVDQD